MNALERYKPNNPVKYIWNTSGRTEEEIDEDFLAEDKERIQDGAEEKKALIEYLKKDDPNKYDFELDDYQSTDFNTRLKNLVATSYKARKKYKKAEKLQAYGSILCIELHLWHLFKDYCDGLSHCREMADKAKDLKSRYTSAFRTTTVQENLTISHLIKPTSTEGLAFYFKIAPGLQDNLNFTPEERKKIQEGLHSENEEIRSLSGTLQRHLLNQERSIKAQTIGRKLVVYILDMNKFVNSLKKSKRQIDQHFLRTLKSIDSFMLLYTSITQEAKKDYVKYRESTLAAHEGLPAISYKIGRPLPQEIITKWKESLADWKKEISTHRKGQFTLLLSTLKELRKNERDKLEFTAKYLGHGLEKLTPITFENYSDHFDSHFKVIEKQIQKPQAKKGRQSRNQSSKGCNRPKLKPKPKLKPQVPRPVQSAGKNEKEKEPVLQKASSKISNKTANKPSKFQFTYSSRVLDWYQEHPHHLQEPSYAQLSTIDKFKQKVYHAPPLEVEDYIESHGFKTTYQNKTMQHTDTLYCIPAEYQFHFKDETVKERGVLSFCKGQDDEIYHCHFSKQPDEDIYHLAENAFYNYDYPALEKIDQKEKFIVSEKKQIASHLEISVDALTEAVKIHDPDIMVTYILFKIG